MAPIWATRRSGHEAHISLHMILVNWAMSLRMLQPDLVWVDADWVPKRRTPAQAQPSLYMMSHISAVPA
jgi:hypothetical protein